jgi:hypothetical protein
MLRNAALLAVLVPTLARAEPGPMFAIGLDYTLGHGGHVEELDLGMRLEAGLFLRVNRWQATFSFPTHPQIRSTRPDRDSDDLTGFGLGGRLAYRAPLFGGILAIGGGITRRWIWAKEDVMRTCAQTGDCIAGAWLERPSYTAWAPQLRIGIGPEKVWPRMVMGASFEIIVEAIGLNDVPPDGVREVTVMGGVTLTIGGGPRRR